MKNNGKGLMALGLLLILAAAGMTGWNLIEDRRAAVSADELLETYVKLVDQTEAEQIQKEIPISDIQRPEVAPTLDSTDVTEEAEEPVIMEPEERGMTTPDLSSGYDVLGALNIPALNLALPVQREWSYPNLRKTPCRYYGSVEEGNLVLVAHNYSSHFGKLKKLQIGDAVSFYDENAVMHRYVVSDMEVLEPVAISELLQTDWALSLVTCTKGGKTRFVVRCDAVTE